MTAKDRLLSEQMVEYLTNSPVPATRTAAACPPGPD